MDERRPLKVKDMNKKTFSCMVRKYVRIAAQQPARTTAFAQELCDRYSIADCTRVQFAAIREMKQINNPQK